MQSFFKAPMHTKCRDPPEEYDVRHDLTTRDVRRWRYRESCRRLGRQNTTDSTVRERVYNNMSIKNFESKDSVGSRGWGKIGLAERQGCRVCFLVGGREND